MSLLSVDVHHGRFVGTLHAAKHLDEFGNVVALLKIFIFKSPSLKPIVLAGAVALTQGAQIFVYAAMVFGYRHLIVVHHDDYACAKFRSLVEPLKCFATR